MAGTTIEDDDFVHRSLMEALDEEKIYVSRDQVNDVMGYPKPIAIAKLLEANNSYDYPFKEDFIKKIHDHFVDKMVGFYAKDSQVKAKDGAEETFKALRKRGIKVALNTGFDRKIANAVLKRLQWQNGMVDVTVTSDEVENGRPYPDMIVKAMELTKISHPEYIMKVGDTVSDLQEGKAAGCRYVVGITTGAYTREQLINEYHTHLIDDLREILEII